jgi:predicted DNA-binding protein with PD1-like motif
MAVMTDTTRYIAVPSGFLMVFRQGDDVFAGLETIMRDEQIPSASIAGFGFVAEARFGYFNFERGDYDAQTFRDLEITGLIGTLAWKDGKPAIHAHAAGGDRQFRMVGGHVLGLVVGRGSFEVSVIVHPNRLDRRLEPDIGANVLQLR